MIAIPNMEKPKSCYNKSAAEKRGGLSGKIPENYENNRSDKRSCCVKMLYKNIRGVSGKNVAQNSAADSGYHSHENKKKNASVAGKIGDFDSDGGENSKAD